MRKKKEFKIKLCTTSGQVDFFTISHAEALLDMGPEVNGGWFIDPDSEYYYDEENGIRLKSNKANSAEAK